MASAAPSDNMDTSSREPSILEISAPPVALSVSAGDLLASSRRWRFSSSSLVALNSRHCFWNSASCSRRRICMVFLACVSSRRSSWISCSRASRSFPSRRACASCRRACSAAAWCKANSRCSSPWSRSRSASVLRSCVCSSCTSFCCCDSALASLPRNSLASRSNRTRCSQRLLFSRSRRFNSSSCALQSWVARCRSERSRKSCS
mmetsp:Transcript_17766/g.39175  ORF Transcript_17766/g.39175 Transcript_17766/m.39175 type:complete len:205 (+) Transcript_17766:1189-1803(+)